MSKIINNEITSREGAGLQEMVNGFLDGYDPDSPTPGSNRSAAYLHGFANGRDDRRGSPRDSAANLREQAAAICALEVGE